MARSWVLVVAIAVFVSAATVDAQLSATFYNSKCPGALAKIAEVTKTWVSANRQLAPALLRLHFHDCFVRGCDASVLLDSTVGKPSEKESAGNKGSLRGMEVVDDIKAKLEVLCPGVVSCADILTVAARDAMRVFGGLNYTVLVGRRDGVVSSMAEGNTNLPPHTGTFTQLNSLFSTKGLSIKDLVVLSGAHTVGFTRCSTIQKRLYNFSSTAATDPTIDPSFVSTLKSKCKFGSTGIVLMDLTKATDTWDPNYFSNVLRGRALFQSDDALRRNSEAVKVVQSENVAPGGPFNADFAASMIKMGNLGVLTGTQGQIRKNCRRVN